MADITEVIHRITYEVNDTALQNAAKAIQTQVAELNTLSRLLQGYKQQLDAASVIETKKIELLNKKISTTSKLLEISAGKAKGTLLRMNGELNTDGLEEHRDEIQRTINSYTSLANAASLAFQTIYNAQIKALDMEIAIREKRVDEAVKLAERGNVEVLKLEEERLKETQKKREQYARRERLYKFINNISNDLFDKIITDTLRDIIAYRNITALGGQVYPAQYPFRVIKPTQFRIKTSTDLLSEFNEGTKANMPAFIRQRMALDFVDKHYSGDGLMKKKARVITILDELSVLSIDEVLKLKAANVITDAELQFSQKLPSRIDELVREKGEYWFIEAGMDGIRKFILSAGT